MSRPAFRLPGFLISLLGLAAVLLVVAYLQGPPRTLPESRHLEIPVGPPRASSDAAEAGAPGGGSPREAPTEVDVARPLVVEIDLEAGEFEIQPAGLGKSVVVEADYEETLHRLEHEFTRDTAGRARFRLVFENRGAWQHLRQALHKIRAQSDRSHRRRRNDFGDARVRVDLPTGVPMDLTLKLGKGKAHVDLSGLSLSRLTLEQAMGEVRLVFDEPNPIEMQSLELRGKMGELRAAGLGYARTRALDFSGRMGSFDLDLDGPWKADVDGSVAISMGDAVVHLPPDLRLQMSNRGVIMGGLHTPRYSSRRSAERADSAATLTLQTSVRFGNLSIR